MSEQQPFSNRDFIEDFDRREFVRNNFITPQLLEPEKEKIIQPRLSFNFYDDTVSDSLPKRSISDVAIQSLRAFLNRTLQRTEETTETVIQTPISAIALPPATVPRLPRPQERKQRWSDTELGAHHYRTGRLRKMRGALAEMHGNTTVADSVRTFVADRDMLLAGTRSDSELHRNLTPFLTGVMTETEGRREFMASLDRVTRAESAELKETARQGKLEADIVIIGAGVQGSIMAARLRAEDPDMRIVTVDAGKRLGGQFRSYGDRPVFSINSRNFRAQNNDTPGLPGSSGNLNSFGPKAPMQLTDFTSEVYPTNLDLGDTAALNQYFSAETMLDVRVEGRSRTSDGEQYVFLRDTVTSEGYRVKATRVVGIPGAGERKSASQYGNVLTAEEVFADFGNTDNTRPMDRYKNKRIAIIGAGDTGRVIGDLFVGLAPREAYGKSTVQLGRPSAIEWYGTDFVDRDGSCNTNRPRYTQQASFIANPGDTPGGKLQIFPNTSKVASTEETKEGVFVTDVYGQTKFFDIAVDARTLQSDIMARLSDDDVTGAPTPVTAYVESLKEETVVAQQVTDNVYIAGPAASSRLTAGEQQTFANAIKENTVSIWANSPRTDALARVLANE
jgi:NAD(P)-binding Rossmann-like domain